jgi:hypothetical protein
MTEVSKTDSITFEKLFDDIRKYWLDKVAKVSVATTEESLTDLSLPLDAQTRLCFFDVPQALVSFYKSNVFATFVRCGYTPIIPNDMISPGDNILPTISSLIERSSLVVIDISSIRQGFSHALQLAIARRIPLIVIRDKETNIPPNLEEIKEIKVFVRPTEIDSEAVEGFIKEVKKFVLGISPDMMQKLFDEPERLLSKGEDKAAVISAFSLLEAELRQKIQKDVLQPIPLGQLLDSAVKKEILEPSLRDKILHWRKIRNELVHIPSAHVDKAQATEIVNGIREYVQRLRSPTHSNSKQKRQIYKK